MRSSLVLIGTCVVLLAGCAGRSPAFNPEDPAAIATIDSLVQSVLDGARDADADKVLALAEGPGEFTFVTGDILLAGLVPIREDFRNTYRGLVRQDHQIRARRIRLLTPDVALYTVVGEGTYTDSTGATSSPVGIGLTLVLVKQDGKWQARHAHQSIAY